MLIEPNSVTLCKFLKIMTKTTRFLLWSQSGSSLALPTTPVKLSQENGCGLILHFLFQELSAFTRRRQNSIKIPCHKLLQSRETTYKSSLSLCSFSSGTVAKWSGTYKRFMGHWISYHRALLINNAIIGLDCKEY